MFLSYVKIVFVEITFSKKVLFSNFLALANNIFASLFLVKKQLNKRKYNKNFIFLNIIVNKNIAFYSSDLQKNVKKNLTLSDR